MVQSRGSTPLHGTSFYQLIYSLNTFTIMENYVMYPQEEKGWSVINGELCEVALQEVFYAMQDNELFTHYMFVTHKGEQYKVEPSNYYENEDNYRKGHNMPWYRMYFNINKKVTPKDDGFEYWTMEDGAPTLKFARISGASKYTDKQIEFYGLPNTDNMYKTREECLTWNEYVVSYEDGRKETRKGVGLLLQLTEDQKKAVKSIEKAMKKAQELGVVFCESYGIGYAINTSGLQEFEIGCTCDEDSYKGEGMDEMFNIQIEPYRCSIGVLQIIEDYSLFFKRK